MASRGQSFSLGMPVLIHRAGDIEIRRADVAAAALRECSFTARTADSATTHSVVHRLHAATPTSPSRLLMQRAASTCQTICPLAFLHQEARAAAQHRQHGPRAAVVQQIPPGQVFAHAFTGSKTKIASFTVSTT